MEQDDRTLAGRLAGLRKARGLSQDQLAGLLSVSRQAVSRWEAGTQPPSPENRKKLARLYSVPMEYLTDTPAGWPPPEAHPPEPVPPAAGDTPARKKREPNWKAVALCALAALILALGALVHALDRWRQSDGYRISLGELKGEPIDGIPTIEFEAGTW